MIERNTDEIHLPDVGTHVAILEIVNELGYSFFIGQIWNIQFDVYEPVDVAHLSH